MMRKFLEWRFCTADSETEWRKLTDPLADHDGGSNLPGAVHESSKKHYLYEVIWGIALLCGVVVYVLWQQTAQRIVRIEHEIAALRADVAAFQQSGLEREQATTYESSSPLLLLETAYLHFEASPETIETVQRIASRVDSKFQQLQRAFGLMVPLSTEKLKVIVDPVTNEHDKFSDAQPMIVDHPKFAAEQYGMSEADALMTELSARLSINLLEKIINSREIKTQWRGMTLALKTTVQLDHGYNRNWQWTDTHLLHRYNAVSYSLNHVYDLLPFSDPGLADQQWQQVSPVAYATASPLVEFILATYGYDKVPELLAAFDEHDSWETLAPALFYLSAEEFQEQWHAYLRKHYPIPG